MNLDLLSLVSEHPIDKIVQSGEFTISHPGALSVSTSTYTNAPEVRVVENVTENTYGRAGIIRGVYSVNGGTTWTALDSSIPYAQEADVYVDGSFNTTLYVNGWLSQVAIGSNNSHIFCRAISDRCTPVFRMDFNTSTFHTTYSLWSSIPQTFIVKWWMYERV